MIVAAAVITRPVDAWPVMTAARLSPRVHPLLVHAADQEDLVVHRQAEQHGERQHRHERVDRTGPAETERVRTPAELEERDDHAERGAGREQVHHRGGERHDDAAERDQQQEEAEHRRSRR